MSKYVKLDDLQAYCDDQIDHAITPNVFNRMNTIDIVKCQECRHSDTGCDEEGRLFMKCLDRCYGETFPFGFCFCGKEKEKTDANKDPNRIEAGIFTENLLTDRTVNIIVLSKRYGYPKKVREAIAKYMSEECDCPIEVYTEHVLTSVVKSAMFDFLHHATRRKDIVSFMSTMMDADYPKMIDRMILALGFIQVAERYGEELLPINGWHETEFSRKLGAGEWGLYSK